MSEKSRKDTTEKPAKQEWVTPAVVDLPRLVDLTLQTGVEGFGGTGGGGSTVF